MNLRRIGDERELSRMVEQGRLVSLPISNELSVAPSLPKERRYVLPMVSDFLAQLSVEYYAQFGVPLQVNSAVRPVTVQRRLRWRNPSAAPVHGEYASSHEAGCTIDLERRRLTKAQRSWLQWRLLYYKALGRVIVEEERACFHTMCLEGQ